MNELVNYQSEAINLANLTEASKKQTVILAAKTGQALIKVKEILHHGDYLPWVDENMPVSNRQCQKYIRLAKEKPSLLSNANSNSHLDIYSELKLLSLDDDVAEKVRETAINEDLTQKEISDLTAQLKEKTKNIEIEQQRVEEWRQQYLDERNGKRELDAELKRVSASKKETIYVDDSEKALQQYKEETERKINNLKADAESYREKLVLANSEMSKAIKDGVAYKIKLHKDEIDRMSKQETSLASSIEALTQEWDQLDNSVGVRRDHVKARAEFKGLMEHMAIKANVIFDEDFTDEDVIEWNRLFDENQGMIETFKNIIDRPELKIVN